jgi:GH15 family glucan-1,4-alpha-glucosidase
MYGIDGRTVLAEENLDHLEGYRRSRPVRIGNDASRQLQLDIYGELVDSIYLYDLHGAPISYDLWKSLRRMIEWVARSWDQPDDGIWEVRGGRQPFVYSKVQCWVALDRALRIAERRRFPMDHSRIRTERDRIFEAIMTKGYDRTRRTFVQYFGSEALDASNLIMPLVHFIAPTDPMMVATLDATLRELVSDSLVHRYAIGKAAKDGLTGQEGTFNMCTFWLAEALTRAGRIEEARLIFEKMLTYANHLGLYAEETGPRGEALGNFPQAFTHMGLISAAWKLDRKLGAGP